MPAHACKAGRNNDELHHYCKISEMGESPHYSELKTNTNLTGVAGSVRKSRGGFLSLAPDSYQNFVRTH